MIIKVGDLTFVGMPEEDMLSIILQPWVFHISIKSFHGIPTDVGQSISFVRDFDKK